MAQRGLMAEPKNRIAGLLGEGVGGVFPVLASKNVLQGLLSAGSKGVDAMESIASKALNNANYGKISPGLPTPVAPLRSFDLDYPRPIAQPQGSPLTRSIDGDALNPRAVIAGRSVVGGGDVALPFGGANIAAGRLGVNPQAASASTLGAGTAGSYRPMFSSNGRFQGPREIKVLDKLSPQDSNQVMGHEFGHLLDDLIAGTDGMAAKGTAKELDGLYDALNKKLNGSKAWTPQADGYKGAEVAREKWAEAFRAYQEDPNFIKTYAPTVAKEIRKRVNTHPDISKVIQFNSAAGLGLMGYQDEPP
jgi:hypothetical protein